MEEITFSQVISFLMAWIVQTINSNELEMYRFMVTWFYPVITISFVLFVMFFLKWQDRKKKKRRDDIKKYGTKYEEKVAKHYQKQHYQTILNGKNFGLNDLGLDVIAFNDDEILLIQCKYYINKRLQNFEIQKIFDKLNSFKISQNKYKMFNTYNLKKYDIGKMKLILAVPEICSLSAKGWEKHKEIKYLKVQVIN